MSKRFASEALEDLDVGSPASKRFRSEAPSDMTGTEENGDDTIIAQNHNNHRPHPLANSASPEADSSGEGEDDDEMSDAPPIHSAPLRQSAPTAGYDDLYLDTIDRQILDFDFEKLCSVSLSNINVYACLVCGRYYQGRGSKSHAYFHSLDEDHHVFINMETHKVYVLPEGYEVNSKSLDDIKFVSDPRYTREDVSQLDKKPLGAFALGGKKEYVPGFVGMNNIKENDYLNVVVQSLSHVSPLRNYFLLEDFTSNNELVKRTSLLIRKIWNPRAFKTHVSPHELLQEISLKSNKRFTLTHQSDPVDFLSWYLGNLHLSLGGSRSKPQSSIVQSIFQGKLHVESQSITATTALSNPNSTSSNSLRDPSRLRFEPSAEVSTETTRFMLLTLDLPPAPLFQDEQERNIIPQVPLIQLLGKYDGVRAQEHLAQRKRYKLMHPLPPFLCFHIKRFSKNKFVAERNPTIVVFDPKGLDISPFVQGQGGGAGAEGGGPIYYDLVANIVHEAVRAKDDVGDSGEEKKSWKVQLLDKGRDEWVVCQDLFVEKAQRELLYLGESYLQVWERRRAPTTQSCGGKGKKGKARRA
ncbi:uncharacterized protein MKZ38_002700 [Zalerion maritima]|uniref:Uncharacterized protein n=1 Tax=Zalerion maritima TaxID=339359 RepID=A0AAD5RPE4_9PEZI|nr:uncharacterized protein MKZ38_002700 [Zalerion maritima]